MMQRPPFIALALILFGLFAAGHSIYVLGTGLGKEDMGKAYEPRFDRRGESPEWDTVRHWDFSLYDVISRSRCQRRGHVVVDGIRWTVSRNDGGPWYAWLHSGRRHCPSAVVMADTFPELMRFLRALEGRPCWTWF